MRRRAIFIGGALCALCSLSLALGCADIFGLGDYTEQEDGGVDAFVGGDASLDSGDAAFDTGIDVPKFGDGGACPGVCVPPLPGGWTFVAYDRAFRTGCATDYGSATNVEEGLSAGAAMCGCSCTPTPPPCSALTITAGDGGPNGCNNATSQPATGDGGCGVLTSPINAQGARVSATVSSGGGGCTPNPSVTVPNVNYSYQGSICEPQAAPGSGCDAGAACMPDPAPYLLCVYQAGAVACPTGYPTQHLIGSTLDDTRGCTQCTCGYDGGTCGGNLTLYTGGNCGATAQTITANGTCQTVSGLTFKSFLYTPSAVGASCTPSTTSAMGDASFADLATVCCAQ